MKKIIMILLVAIILVFTGCNVSYSTAHITDAAMSSGEVNGAPTDEVTSYSPQADTLYAFGYLDNAPDGTTVRFVWKYITADQIIDEVTFESDGQNGIYIFSTLTNDGNLWPIGDYRVDFYIDEREEPDQTVQFTIE